MTVLRSLWLVLVASCVGLTACRSCKDETSGPSPAASASSAAVAESVPRCRGDAQRLAVAGDDVVVGDVAVGPGGLLVGMIRSVEGGRRVQSVLRAPLDLGTSRVIDVGTAFGDDPPPSPRWQGTSPRIAYMLPRTTDGGPRLRELRVAVLEDDRVGRVEAALLQQSDESTAFDVAWNESAGLAAWDEDAPPRQDASTGSIDRGFVKIAPLVDGARAHVVSPESSDAESPRLLARSGGGFWLGWLARRVEEDAYAVEGPGEKRAFRWVEVVPLSAQGEVAGPVRRISPEKGRAAAFELVRHGSDLVVVVQDEAAPSEGAGARVVRYAVGEKIDGSDIVDGGIGNALAELVPAFATNDDGRWLAWTDTTERTRMTPLGGGLLATGRATAEPAFEGARVLASAPPDAIYALVGASGTDAPGAPARPRPELRRFVCAMRAR